MAELVGGAFLATALQVVFERLSSPEIFNYFHSKKLKDCLLKKLHIILISVNQVIEDAEERQYRNPNVKKWLDELKDEVFKAEDLLDEIVTEASLQKMYAVSHTVTSKVRGFFAPFLSAFDKKVESRIQELLDNLEYLIKQNEILGLKDGSGAGSEERTKKKSMRRSPTISLTYEYTMCGRDADKEIIIEKLISLSEVDGNQPLNVISITAMGGMGKTTLARTVYEDRRINDQFELRAWLCISQEFHVDQVTRTILHELHCETEKLDDLISLQLKLKEKLVGKKFLLVLDDVWNENRRDWESLQSPLKNGVLGSKILVTTRSTKVSDEVMHSSYSHHLKPLQDKDCWSLFEKHAFTDQHNRADSKLESIGKKIVQKCRGLPLAIKTLGSLLHTKLSHQAWEKILESDMWDFSEDDSNIIPSLRLSYHYLPSNHKRCFAYCSIFPKDYEIDKDLLIQLWMAEGLLHPSGKGLSMEEVGYEVFNDLESRSFFEPSKSDSDHVVMHDLLNDLAKSVVGDFCLQLEGDLAQNITTKTRYFSFLDLDYHKFKSFEPISKCNQLRGFISLTIDNSHMKYIDRSQKRKPDHLNDRRLLSLKERFALLNYRRFLSRLKFTCVLSLEELFARLKFTRVLSLEAYFTRLKYTRALSLNGLDFQKLAIDVSNLRHLRYLDLSYTGIRKLPSSMCLLINLQTLKLKSCYRLTKLPSDFHKLINLCHLDLENCCIRKMPKYMGRLEHLRTMTQFVVGKNRESDLKELGALKRLKGKLTLSFMGNITDPINAKKVQMKDKHLDELALFWKVVQNSKASQYQECILEALQPNCNLKRFSVSWYMGTRFPNWFDDSYLSKLVSLNLRKCRSLVKLPPLGQLPSLHRLEIDGCCKVKAIDRYFYGNGSSTSIASFRSLSYLSFNDMKKWEEWYLFDEGECFSSLQELFISSCPKLTKSLPQHFPSLKKLTINDCNNLEASLPRAPSLEELHLKFCRKISVKDMPTCSLTDVDVSQSDINQRSQSQLPLLHSLKLYYCAAMESLPQCGLLPRLRSLSIRNCPKLFASRKDWGLCRLHYLEEIEVADVEMESFPDEGLLPPTVQSLTFNGCKKLKAINYRGLLHLDSLKSLYFFGCPKLTFEGLPEEGLPTSISHLRIDYGCQLLKERCQREIGPDWPKIYHIPHIQL